MPKVYSFTGFPKQLGVIVGEDETIYEAVTEALVEWVKGEVTKFNLPAYLESRQISQVKEFPNTDKGWDEAFKFKEEITNY